MFCDNSKCTKLYPRTVKLVTNRLKPQYQKSSVVTLGSVVYRAPQFTEIMNARRYPSRTLSVHGAATILRLHNRVDFAVIPVNNVMLITKGVISNRGKFQE